MRVFIFFLILLLALACDGKPPAPRSMVPQAEKRSAPGKPSPPFVPVYPTADKIEILFPSPYRSYQREGGTLMFGGYAHILIMGVYSGAPSAIEARFAGGDWSIVDLAPVKNVFIVALPYQGVGVGTLEVRFVNNHSVCASVLSIRVGDVKIA